jgi:hypothetical protein
LPVVAVAAAVVAVAVAVVAVVAAAVVVVVAAVADALGAARRCFLFLYFYPCLLVCRLQMVPLTIRVAQSLELPFRDNQSG